MKGAGVSLLVVGTILLFIAISMDTSVSTYAPSTSIYVPSLPSTVNNIGLLQQQLMTFQAGLAAILAGTIFLAAGLIVEAINPLSKQDSAPPPAYVPPEPAEVRPLSPEEMAADDRKMWIVLAVVIAAAIIVMLLVALLSGMSETDNGTEANYSENTFMGNVEADLSGNAN